MPKWLVGACLWRVLMYLPVAAELSDHFVQLRNGSSTPCCRVVVRCYRGVAEVDRELPGVFHAELNVAGSTIALLTDYTWCWCHC